MREGEGGEDGLGSCDPTAPRSALQAGETQAHVGAPLRHELVEARAAGTKFSALVIYPGEQSAALPQTVTF